MHSFACYVKLHCKSIAEFIHSTTDSCLHFVAIVKKSCCKHPCKYDFRWAHGLTFLGHMPIKGIESKAGTFSFSRQCALVHSVQQLGVLFVPHPHQVGHC